MESIKKARIKVSILAGLSALATACAIWTAKGTISEGFQYVVQRKYASEHLDSTAVKASHPTIGDWMRNWTNLDMDRNHISYIDTDKDGAYMTAIARKNSNGEWVDICMAKGLEGKIIFTNLSKTAVDPLHVPKNPWGLVLDYEDINGDGKLESITYLGLDNENPQRMLIERIDGKYVLSPSDSCQRNL